MTLIYDVKCLSLECSLNMEIPIFSPYSRIHRNLKGFVTHSQTDCNENQLDIRVEGFATSYLIREIQTPLARSD